jgi:hypothetical protein
MEPSSDKNGALQLPYSIVSPANVNRLVRELETIDNFLSQAALRQGGTPVNLPRSGQLLTDFINLNKLNLLQKDDLKKARAFMAGMQKYAPAITISFSVEPTSVFINKLIIWLRQNIHPALLLKVGLEPNLVVGCIVRTTNKQFDFSLKKHLSQHRDVLYKLLFETTAEAKT